MGKRVVDEAMHGPRLAEHVLVDKSRDEVRRKGDDKGLQREEPDGYSESRLNMTLMINILPRATSFPPCKLL